MQEGFFVALFFLFILDKEIKDKDAKIEQRTIVVSLHMYAWTVSAQNLKTSCAAKWPDRIPGKTQGHMPMDGGSFCVYSDI